jgi:uncharacterized protein (TIGR03437 family)
MDGILLFDRKGNVWSKSAVQIIDAVNIFDSRPSGVTCAANAASFLTDAIAPGEVISIFGSEIGPAEPAGLELDPTGLISTYAAGTSVYFNGIAAPLLYLSRHQINAIVPSGVTGPEVSILVRRDGVNSTPAYFPYADAFPAIFTTTGTGYGQGMIQNEDGSPNSFSNQAQQGSVISIYATGIGPLTGLTDGSIPEKAEGSAVVPVTVQVSGLPLAFDVLSVTAAPGLPVGVVRIQARVPRFVYRDPSQKGAVFVTVAVGRPGAARVSPPLSVWMFVE